MLFDVARRRMTNCHSCVCTLSFLTKHRSKRFADDIASSQNYDFCAVGFHIGPEEQFTNARRCARSKTCQVVEYQFADVHRMKTINILFRLNARIDSRFRIIFWQRRLNQDSMESRIIIQFLNSLEQCSFATIFGQSVCFRKDAEFRASLFLATNIDFRGRVFTDAHEREAGLNTAPLQVVDDPQQRIAEEFRRDGAAVNDVVPSPGGFGR